MLIRPLTVRRLRTAKYRSPYADWPKLYVGTEALLEGKPDGHSAPTYLNPDALATRVRDRGHPVEVVRTSNGQWMSKADARLRTAFRTGCDRPEGWVEIFTTWTASEESDSFYTSP